MAQALGSQYIGTVKSRIIVYNGQGPLVLAVHFSKHAEKALYIVYSHKTDFRL